jgi:hypothetical protein
MHHRDRSRGARVMISLDSAMSTVAAADARDRVRKFEKRPFQFGRSENMNNSF